MDEIKELLETKQYTSLRQKMAEMNVADIAVLLEELQEEDMLKVFRILPKDLAADVFSYLEVENQQVIITSLTDREAANIINNLMADDATDFLEEMPANIVKRLLANASPEMRRDINHLLRYPDESAGSIMTVEYVDLKEDLTLDEAIIRIRQVGLESETIDVCYVLDRQRKLVGTVELRWLLFSEPGAKIRDIMDGNVISVHTLTDQEEVVRQFQKYDFTTMPVVDNEDRLVGIITVDDIVDIMQEEATEDIERMAAITPSDKPYLKTGIWETYKKRIPWLLLLMVSATFTSQIIDGFQEALSTLTVLTVFIPMLMGMGGNAGGQTSATIIRGLSLGEIEYKDIFIIIWKEARVAVMCGITLTAANFAKLMLFDRVGLMVSLVVCLTLVLVILLAKIIGCILPILAKLARLDPAVMASPFITTILDALSLLVYFQIATRMLGLS